jgi:hypothetical protein
MGDRKRIGSLFCLPTNLARNRTAIRKAIRTRVDSPLVKMNSLVRRHPPAGLEELVVRQLLPLFDLIVGVGIGIVLFRARHLARFKGARLDGIKEEKE